MTRKFAPAGCSPPAPGRIERSCEDRSTEWLREDGPVAGVARLRARLQRRAYATHRHDTYTIALTESGVQEFGYRGSVHRSLPGQVVVLHPDEAHDGHAASPDDGFSYCSLYLDPARVFDAVRSGCHASALPFVPSPVLDAPDLADVLRHAFDAPLDALGAEELIHTVSLALLRAAGCKPMNRRAIDDTALAKVRAYLDAHFTCVVTASELERVSGLSRFALCTQFKQRFGTSPYRYLMMRRLAHVRSRLHPSTSIAQLSAESGFADQAHMTRMFRAAFGFTPAALLRMQR